MSEGEQDEAPEIIARPPSHPITTTLLGVSIAATIVCIGFSWAELFGCYMPTNVEKGMEKHKSSGQDGETKKRGGSPIDHYAEDYPGKDVLWYQVGQDLKVSGGASE